MLKQLATPQMGDFAHLIAKAAREGQSAVIHKYHDILLSEQHARIRREHPNPFVRNGMKFFSQSDEDGITIEIIKRLGILNGTFAEYGVGEAPRRFVWKPTATIGGGRSAVWACGQVAERLVHMPMRPCSA